MRKREREKITTQKVHGTNKGGSEVKEKEKEKAFSEEGSFGVVTQKYVRIARCTNKEWMNRCSSSMGHETTQRRDEASTSGRTMTSCFKRDRRSKADRDPIS